MALSKANQAAGIGGTARAFLDDSSKSASEMGRVDEREKREAGPGHCPGYRVRAIIAGRRTRVRAD